MSLKARYFALIVILHLAIVILLYLLFKDQKWYFLISELIVLILFILSARLYRSINYPFQLLKSGKDTMMEEDFTIKFNPTGTKEIDELVKVYNNMIDQLRMEKTRTEEQSYFLEDLIEHSPLGMLIMDYERVIVIANRRAKKIFENDGLIGLHLADIDHPLAQGIDQLSTFQEKIITIGGIKKYKCKLHQLIHKGFSRQFVMIEELTGELLDAEKQAYGKVIRMMAHEVNNSMGAVNSILENVKEYGLSGPENEELRDYVNIAMDRNLKLGKFTNNFAEFVRLPKPNKNKIDLNQVVLQLTDYLKLQAAERKIDFDLRIYTEPVVLQVDKIQIEQVISNIIKNAFESIEKNGMLRITTHQEPPHLIIADNGPGIDQETAEKIFTPFFSTKQDGQGIGLMLIRDVLNNHEASYQLYTDEKDGWTKFEISF